MHNTFRFASIFIGFTFGSWVHANAHALSSNYSQEYHHHHFPTMATTIKKLLFSFTRAVLLLLTIAATVTPARYLPPWWSTQVFALVVTAAFTSLVCHSNNIE